MRRRGASRLPADRSPALASLASFTSLTEREPVTSALRRRPAWLLVSALGVLLAYRAVMDSMPPCNCFEWRYLERYLDKVGFRDLAAPLAVAAGLVIVGIAGSFGLVVIGRPPFVDAALRTSGELWSRVVRRGLLWPVFTTALGIPTALFMLSGRPNMLGLVPLGGVLIVWTGFLMANRNLVALGAFIGVGSGLLILGWVLTLLVLLLGMRI